MKKKIFPFIILFLFLVMLIFPQITLSGASKGLLLWFQTIVPTLLPFIIITNLLINTDAFHWLNRLFFPIFSRVFHISEQGSFAVLCGYLCGYPMGSKIVNDLYVKNYITKMEASYLLSFCNNVSPVFIISYITLQNLKRPDFILPTIIIMMISPVICSYIFKPFYKNNSVSNLPKYYLSQTSEPLFDSCIMNGFETLTRVGGYIIFFSVITEFLNSFIFCSNLISYTFVSSIEITNGIKILSDSYLSFHEKYILTLSLASFGGWCSIAQTKSMIQNSSISIFPYIIEKLITALVTSLLAYVFIKLY